MAKRIIRRGIAALQAELGLLEALKPFEDNHQDAKERFSEAVASGDRARIVAAKQAKVEAANRLEDVRTWLRREAAIVKLQTITIPRLEQRLAAPILADGKDAGEDLEERARLEGALAAARAELEALGREATAFRAGLEALGAVVSGHPVPPDLPPGSADVTVAPIAAKTTVNRRKEK
ncbi:hypothetical protein ACBI99_44665 [Nonomuraea sp. ATR24]|uniref:hypothetical protein n=1 Tax=Nonomuraea sp. ATR24 TaxID=1676744 RepID=UPI0035C177F4